MTSDKEEIGTKEKVKLLLFFILVFSAAYTVDRYVGEYVEDNMTEEEKSIYNVSQTTNAIVTDHFEMFSFDGKQKFYYGIG